jgi:hypothetical protein
MWKPPCDSRQNTFSYPCGETIQVVVRSRWKKQFTDSLNRTSSPKHSYKRFRHFYLPLEIQFIKVPSGNQLKYMQAAGQTGRVLIHIHVLCSINLSCPWMQLPSAALSVNDNPEHLKYMCTLSSLPFSETREMKKWVHTLWECISFTHLNGRALHKADITVDTTVQKAIHCTVRSVNQQLRYNAIKVKLLLILMKIINIFCFIDGLFPVIFCNWLYCCCQVLH